MIDTAISIDRCFRKEYGKLVAERLNEDKQRIYGSENQSNHVIIGLSRIVIPKLAKRIFKYFLYNI